MLMRYMMAVMLMLGTATLTIARPQSVGAGLGRPGQVQRDLFLEDPEIFINTGPVQKAPGTPAGDMVSVNELKLPDKALKELQRSDKALRAGNMRESAEHLEKALAIYPNLPYAHNQLGLRDAALKDYDKALDEFSKALTLKPDYRLALDDTATVLSLQHRYAEAELAARRALQIEPGAPLSQYILGTTLVQQGKYSDEATELLEKVKTNYPRASLFLAAAAANRQENTSAEEELWEYLQSPESTYRQLAQTWLVILEKRQELTAWAKEPEPTAPRHDSH
jgi:tetratricopeptide (TPR) repeat protein